MKTNITTKGTAIAAGLALTLSAVGVANANLITQYGTGSTTYSVMNVGSSPATVVAAYYNPNGSQQLPVAQNTYTVPVNGRVDVNVQSDGPTAPNWSGSVVLSSDQDIVAVAQTKYTGRLNANETNPGQTAGTEASVYEAFNSGSTALYFPVLVRIKRAANPTVAQLTTRFTVQNTSASPATVYLNFRNFDNTTYPPVVVNLNGYGSRTWDTAVNADLPPGLNLTPNSIALSLLVTATQPLVGVAEQSWNFEGFIGATPVKQNWAADYTAIPPAQAATTLYGPLVARVGTLGGSNWPCTFGNYISFFFFTQFAVQNTTANTATVTATFIRSNTNNPSGQPTGSYTVQVPPFGTWNVGTFAGGNLGIDQTAASFWNIFADGYNAGTGAATHCNWNGSVVFTSDQPIVGFGFVQQPLSIQNYASGYNFFSASGATSTAVLPRADRVCTGSCNFTAVEQFPDFSGVVVQNVGNANTNLTLTFYNLNGTVNQTFTVDGSNIPITLAPGQQYTFNTRAGANASIAQTQALGNNFKGTVVVTATNGVPIRIFNLLVSGMDDADAYVGFNR